MPTPTGIFGESRRGYAFTDVVEGRVIFGHPPWEDYEPDRAERTNCFGGDGYASADMALWDHGPDCDEEPRLVAYATQMFLFSFAD